MTAVDIAPKIILITDPSWSIGHVINVVNAAAAALAPGQLMVQLRDKKTPRQVLVDQAERLREATKAAGALLTLNTLRLDAGKLFDLAERIGADGIHTECSMHAIASAQTAARWVSVPSHSDDEGKRAHMAFADAVLVSPIFLVPGKGKPRGLPALMEARRWKPRVYALGGVAPLQAAMCARAGAHGVAVIRALLGASDPAAAARELAKPFLAAPAPRDDDDD